MVYAINTVSEGFQITTSQRTIDAHGTCRKVVKTSGNDVFAPTKTAAEWNAFISNKPASVNLGQCCEGTMYAGYCWYAGNPAVLHSCTDTCSSHGGVNMSGTRDYVGSGGSLSNCTSVVTAMGFSFYNSWDSPSGLNAGPLNPFGCTYWPNGSESQVARYRNVTTTADAAHTYTYGYRRICACNE